MKKVIVIKASWCGPCKVYGPMVEQARPDIYNAGYELEFIDADERPELLEKYKVRGVPTTIVLDREEVLSQWAGTKTKQDLLAELI